MKYYTCIRPDRIGMQIYGCLHSIHWCQINHVNYIHKPLAQDWENLFNFKENCRSDTELPNFFDFLHIKNSNYFYNLKYSSNIEQLEDVSSFIYFSKYFRDKMMGYYQPNIKTSKPKDIINICIHVRRGDTLKKSHRRSTLRFVSDSFISRCLDAINLYIKKPCVIHLHSDSDVDLTSINTYNLDIKTMFKSDPLIAMQDMISCDVLFRSGVSAFSGVAAFYNTNTIISDMPSNFTHLYKFDNTYTFHEAPKILQTL